MKQQPSMHNNMAIKLYLLSNGVNFDSVFLDNYSPEFIEKRWAYGNSDEKQFVKRIPPEILIGDIISAVHFVPESDLQLGFVDGKYVLKCNEKTLTEVSFPGRPKFYEMSTDDGIPCNSVATLYGSNCLGIFALGTCYYFHVDKPCGFCSLEPTRGTLGDHVMQVRPELAAQVTEIALNADPEVIKQIMLNGGNRRDNNAGFLHHLKTIEMLSDVLVKMGRIDSVELHLITMPPDNHALLKGLQNLPVKVAMNLEVFSPELFPLIAPGKAELYGREKIIEALRRAVDELGKGNVYTIFVGGLEPMDSLIEGLHFVAQMGVVPIINVFHKDPAARLSDHPRVPVAQLHQMGKALQEVFEQYEFKPFYRDCGRNSLDSEAFYGCF